MSMLLSMRWAAYQNVKQCWYSLAPRWRLGPSRRGREGRNESVGRRTAFRRSKGTDEWLLRRILHRGELKVMGHSCTRAILTPYLILDSSNTNIWAQPNNCKRGTAIDIKVCTIKKTHASLLRPLTCYKTTSQQPILALLSIFVAILLGVYWQSQWPVQYYS